MKGFSVMLCLPLVVLFSSCSTDVDLYADYKEIPVIYGLLDARADTNFIKITRAFYAEGDATQYALDPDMSSYPGKLDVRLVEYCNKDSIREIMLDTITIHNKQQGVFYAPDQKLYYTTEPLSLNTKRNRYSYRLKVVFPEGTLTTETDLVGNDGFDVQSLGVNFSKEYFGKRRPFLFHPAINAACYDVTLAFTFKEQRTPDGDSVPRTMYWNVGTYMDLDVWTESGGDLYVFYYYPEHFYEKLTEFLGGDTAIAGLHRFISDYPVEVIISAGGEKLKQYVEFNNATGGLQVGNTDFSLIDGGYGVFSSRMTVSRRVRLGGTTIPDLEARRYWGFKFIGGREATSADQ